MSTLTAPIRPPIASPARPAHHRRIVERTITVTRELIIDTGQETRTEATGLERLILSLALWLIERRRIRALRTRVDSAEMSRRVDAAKQRHIDRYHALPY